jgi:hypothetical protein
MRSSRLKVRTVAVDLGDDAGLRWVSLVPRGVINAHGMLWNFDAEETNPDELRFRWEDAVESVQRWLTVFAPPVAIEHDKNGTAAGYLRKVVSLTAAEAAAHGINQKAPAMLYGGLDLTSPKWAAAFDDGEVPYVSPNIRAWAGTELEDAPTYPFAIGEVSFVTIPQIKAQQVPVAEMRGVSLSEGALMMTREELTGYCAELGLDEAAIAALVAKLFPDLHKADHEANPELADAPADLDPEALEGAALELQKAAQDIEETKKAEDATLSEVKRLKADLAAARKAVALANVKVALGNRKVSPATESLLADAYLVGGGKFEALLKDLAAPAPAARPAARSVVPMGRASTEVTLSEVMGRPEKFAALSEDAQWKLITELSEKEKCHPAFAASWITFGETPATVVEQRATKGIFR